MWNTCTGKWCGSAYEQAYREGYEQGYTDGEKAVRAEIAGITNSDDLFDKYLSERVAEEQGEESGSKVCC